MRIFSNPSNSKGLFLYVIGCFLVCFPFFSYGEGVKEILKKIPVDEYRLLEKLFYSLMHNEHFSYTLFGDKPVSLASNFLVTPLCNTMCKMKSGGVFWKNWSIWKKYETHFPMKRFLLIETPPQNNKKTIILINKKLFIQIATQHLDLFQEFLGSNITPEGLLNEIELTNDFFSIVKDNHLLIGLLLGYGGHNSKLFFQRDKPLFFTKSKTLPKIPYKIPEPKQPFSSLEEECKSVHTKLTPFGDYSYSPVIAKSVHFVAEKGHPETRKLEKKYQKFREKISMIYAQGNILEISLSALVSE